MTSLDSKHALITGGSRGIGRGIALRLAEDGAKVAVHYYQNESAAEDTLAEIRKRGSDGFIVQGDVRRMDEIPRIFAEVRKQFGKLDILVANARPEVPEFFEPPMKIALEQWDAAFDSQGKAFLVAVREASVYDTRLIFETFIPGREMTVAVFEDRALPVVEIVPNAGVYDYKSKYTSGSSRYQVPAQIPAPVALMDEGNPGRRRAVRRIGTRLARA